MRNGNNLIDINIYILSDHHVDLYESWKNEEINGENRIRIYLC